eukprot:11165059-Lingulodinium_polyedra.AAC.1
MPPRRACSSKPRTCITPSLGVTPSTGEKQLTSSALGRGTSITGSRMTSPRSPAWAKTRRPERTGTVSSGAA